MILNRDDYLFLKQLLCILQAQRSGVEVAVESAEMPRDRVMVLALGKLKDIHDNFTIPYALINRTEVHVDFMAFAEGISDLLDKIEEGSDLHEIIQETNQKDNLYRAVMEYPNLKYWIGEHRANVEASLVHGVSNTILSSLNEEVDKGLLQLQHWIESEDSTHPVSQMVILVNCIQLVDELYQFSNDFYGVEDGSHS